MAVNRYLDPGFESGALGYDIREVETGVTDATRVVGNFTESSDPAYGPLISGDWSLRLKATANANTGIILSVGRRVPCAVASTWSATVLVAYASAGLKGRLSLGFQNAKGEDISAEDVVLGPELLLGPETLLGAPHVSADGAVAGTAVARLKVENQAAPFGAAYVALRLSVVAEEKVAGSVTFDDVVLVEEATAPDHAIEGDLGGMDWSGSRFTSPSFELGEAPTTPTWQSWTPGYLWAPEVLSKEL